VRMHSGLSKMFKVGKDALNPGHRCRLSHQLDTVRSKIDLDVQPIFHQTKVLVARAIQRLDSGS